MKRFLPKGKFSFPTETPRLKAYILILIATVIWAVAGPVIKFTLEGIPSLPFLVYRFYLSTIAALISFLIFGFHFPKDRNSIIMLFVYGIFSTPIALGLLFFGMESSTVLEMSLITLMMPLVITAGGAIFLKEHVTKREKIGVTIAFLGTVFTVIEPILSGGQKFSHLSGNLLLLLYVVANVVPAILVKFLTRNRVSPNLFSNFAFIIGFVTLLPFLLLQQGPIEFVTSLWHLPLKYHLGVLFMAFISGNIAFTLANKAQKTIEVGDASIFAYLYPLFAIPLAIFWLHEKITWPFIIGALIIAAGVLIAEYKGKSLQLAKTK